MNIRQTFLTLTKKTYPYKFEDGLIKFLPNGSMMDPDGNYFFEILNKDNTPTRTIFTCHLDTACNTQVDVQHLFDGRYIKTNGKSILGADDKAGMTIMLYMIHNMVPGLYYFFIGEEKGCIGSRAASLRKEFFSNYERMVSFDRRGTTSVITHQSSRRTCSDEFAKQLSKQLSQNGLSFKPDDTGVYTDSAEFASIISECTNISVGYNKEHTVNESQDIEFLETLCNVVIKIDWDNISASRDPKIYDYKSYYNNNSYYYDTMGYSNGYESKRKRNRRKRSRSYDTDFWRDEDLAYGYGYSQPDYYFVNGQKVYYSNTKKEVVDDYYASFREMYLNPDLTKEELDVIKRDFLNKDSKEDMMFSDYMSDLF